mmetsp:Transcript_46884/g.110347  ORF Transcript_46884/g.110347 Transcript_46884/m.110347 type:complete len:213 (-) Transcript_46884:3031-3669(-)
MELKTWPSMAVSSDLSAAPLPPVTEPIKAATDARGTHPRALWSSANLRAWRGPSVWYTRHRSTFDTPLAAVNETMFMSTCARIGGADPKTLMSENFCHSRFRLIAPRAWRKDGEMGGWRPALKTSFMSSWPSRHELTATASRSSRKSRQSPFTISSHRLSSSSMSATTIVPGDPAGFSRPDVLTGSRMMVPLNSCFASKPKIWNGTNWSGNR